MCEEKIIIPAPNILEGILTRKTGSCRKIVQISLSDGLLLISEDPFLMDTIDEKRSCNYWLIC